MLKAFYKYTSLINPKSKFYKYAWIQAKDFRDLLSQADLFGYTFVDREAFLAFLLSMMTQVDELNKARHY